MKKTLLLAVIALVLCACGTTFKSAEEKAAYEAKLVKQVNDKLHDRHFTIEVTYMKPLGSMPAREVNGFNLQLKGDTVVSYLPYYGRVSSGMFGFGGDTGLNFTSKVEKYAVTHPKADLTRINFETRSKEDRYQYEVEVFTNGKASISVIGDGHQSINFDGEMKLDY